MPHSRRVSLTCWIVYRVLYRLTRAGIATVMRMVLVTHVPTLLTSENIPSFMARYVLIHGYPYSVPARTFLANPVDMADLFVQLRLGRYNPGI